MCVSADIERDGSQTLRNTGAPLSNNTGACHHELVIVVFLSQRDAQSRAGLQNDDDGLQLQAAAAMCSCIEKEKVSFFTLLHFSVFHCVGKFG